MLPTLRQLFAVFLLLPYGMCSNIPLHIQKCKAVCKNVQGQTTHASQSGFLFMKCSVLAETKDVSSSATKDKTSEDLMEGREHPTGIETRYAALKRIVCHKKEGGVEKSPPAEVTSLLILPEHMSIRHGYQLNLATKQIHRFNVPWKSAWTGVYIRNEERFLIAQATKIRSFQLNRKQKLVIVKRIKHVVFMRFDDWRQLIFLSEHYDNKCTVSRMRRHGGKYRVLRSVGHAPSCYTALDSDREVLYIAAYRSLVRDNYEGREVKTLAEDTVGGIVAVNVDRKLNIVYYVKRSMLMKLIVSGQSFEMLDVGSTAGRPHFLEFHSNALYIIRGYLDDGIVSVENLEDPSLKTYPLPKEAPTNSFLCLM